MIVTKYENSIDYKFISITVSTHDGVMQIIIDFKPSTEGSYLITMIGTEAQDFYDNWDSDAVVYEKLVERLDVKMAVPQDIVL